MPVLANDTTAKQFYLSALNDLLGYDKPGANPKILFQPFADLVKVDWDKPNAPDFNKFKQSTFLDKLPTWGTFAVPTDTSLYEAFGDFLQTLNNKVVATADESQTVTPADLQTIKKLQGVQQTAYGDKNSGYKYYESLAEGDWTDAITNNPNMPSSPYDKLNYLQSNSNYIIAMGYLNEADNASYQILDILSKADPNYKLLAAAKINYSSANYKMNVPEDISDEGRVKDYVFIPQQGFDRDIFDFEAGTLVSSCSINNQTRSSDYTETHWGGSFGVSFGFFSVGGSIHVDEITSLIHEKDISITLQFQNLAPFIVTRGGWYDQYVIDKLGGLLPEYFGQAGALALIPQQIICAKGVEVTINTDDATSSLFYTHMQSGGSFGIGPFNFGGSYDSTHIHAESSLQGGAFTMKSTENEAYILGQLCYLAHSTTGNFYKLKESFLSYKAKFDKKMADKH